MIQTTLFGPQRGTGQTPGEDNYTPDALARFCLDLLPWDGIDTVLEPHAGGGAFVRDLKRRGVYWIAYDIDPECPAVLSHDATVMDFLSPAVLANRGIDRCVGNWPFTDAEKHVDRALAISPECATLLPLSRTKAHSRRQWYQNAPLRHVWIVQPNPFHTLWQLGFWWFDRAWPHSWWGTELVSWK